HQQVSLITDAKLRPSPSSLQMHLLRAAKEPSVSSLLQADRTVSGARKRSITTSRACSFSPRNRPSSERGSVATSTAAGKRPWTFLQKEVVGNALRHHTRQRLSVRRLTPVISRRRAARFAVIPPSMAVASTTTADRYTRRPRNRSDGGVVRFRHPSRAQQ